MTWIWHLCLTNMKQRGVRTFLTILGVVIGVISIVSLLAIGIGVKNELLSVVESTGSITEVRISGVNEGKRKDKMITDRRAVDLEKIEYVKAVYPQTEIFAKMDYKNFTGYTVITGIPKAYMDEIEIGKGEKPVENGIKPELLVGNHAMDIFFNESTGAGFIETDDDGENKEVPDLTGEDMMVQFNMEEDNEKGSRLKISGMTKDNTYNMYCNLDVLKKYLKQNAEDGKIPGQPVNANNENYNEWIYDSAIVKVDDVEHVEKVIKRLQDMGFQTENNKELLDSMQREIKVVQFLLGGIGMIALIVAVIGIGNTMTTSVYDRINEIGILKVLGCDPDELLYLFLLESGILGGLGGLIGIIISYGMTEIGVNKLAVKLLNMPKGTELAVIPLWLAVFAFIFAVILGVLAGFFPAKWAAKLKPIEAVRK
ncbi:MAG: ABC transporter permease [Lachnospiraceae bacterium]|nr:ABC transporter permease [Lachnospiraceae bacterium]